MHVSTHRGLADADPTAVAALLDAARAADGRAPLSERKGIDLLEDGPDGLVTVLLTDGSSGEVAGLAQVSGHEGAWGIELVVHPDRREEVAAIERPLVEQALDEVAGAGGGKVHLWVTDAAPEIDALAAELGLRAGRELHQLRRALPVDGDGDASDRGALPTRPFVPGRDEAAWLEVNNRAFASHPEQGGWTAATLAARVREPWFDPEGFRLHERDGRLAGFCWTKVHRDQDPPVGEIYVIGVDPAFRGHGIGRPLVLAGLDWLAGQGITQAMLYADGDNRPALRMYADLGFTVDHVDRAYVTDVPPP